MPSRLAWCNNACYCSNPPEPVPPFLKNPRSTTGPVSYWWPTASCCSSSESCELLNQHCFDKSCVCIHESIHPLNIINLAIDLPSEEASVSYPECILWAIVCPVSYCVSCELLCPVRYCVLIGMSHKLPPTLCKQPSNKGWVQVGGCRVCPAGQVSTRSGRTCYQECCCHLITVNYVNKL